MGYFSIKSIKKLQLLFENADVDFLSTKVQCAGTGLVLSKVWFFYENLDTPIKRTPDYPK